MVTPLPPTSLPVLTELKCPNCGSNVAQRTPNAQTLVCPACQSFINITMDGASLGSKGSKIPPPPVPLKIGQRFTLGGTSFFVLGRVLYKGWDDEESWMWNEWLLGANDGRLLWLSHDKEDGFVIFTKLRIRKQFDPLKDHTIPVSEQASAVVKERYPAQILGAEGELTWKAERGEKLTMIEGKKGDGTPYSVQFSTEELEVYEGKRVDEMEMATASDDKEWAEGIATRRRNSSSRGNIGCVMLVFAIIAGIAAIIANGTGELAVSQNIVLSQPNSPTGTFKVNFEQAERPAIIRIWANEGDLPLNSYAEIDIEVVSPDESETPLFEHEFWYETGVDEGERWTERDTFRQEIFVPHQVGEHDINMSLGETAGGVTALNMRVAVYRNHLMPLHFLLYAGVVGLIGIILILSTASGTKK